MALSDRLRGAFNRITGRTDRAMEEWARVFEAECRRVVGVQGSEDDRSKPGEPPRRQTGEGQASIVVRWDRSARILKVTSNRYMAWHDTHLRAWRQPAYDASRHVLDSIKARLR